MTRRTALYEEHKKSGAKFVDFFGWELPIHYGSLIQEHHAVRRSAGMFDVSHMTIVDITGDDAKAFLRFLLANDINKCQAPGKALYSCMLNENGGIIDDLIVYYFDDYHYRLVVNAATREKDIHWIQTHAKKFNVEVTHPENHAMIAVQGPEARTKACSVLPKDLANPAEALKPFYAVKNDTGMVARTGYTGEDGFELILPDALAQSLWQALLNKDVAPCGLGARDTLRLEAAMNLYGQDMNEEITPYEANLGWTVALSDRDFIGKAALQKQKAENVPNKLIGLVLLSKGVLREHQNVIFTNGKTGIITSGTFSPTLGKAIGLARIPSDVTQTECHVDIRGKHLPARVVKPPFVRQGKSCLEGEIA